MRTNCLSFFIAFFVCVGPVLFAQEVSSASEKPEKTPFVKQLVLGKEGQDDAREFKVDLGKLPVKTTVDVHVPILNLTGGKVQLLEVKSSCGCVAFIEKNSVIAIEDGRESKLKLKVTTPLDEGVSEKSVVLVLQKGSVPEDQFAIKLALHIEVKRAISITPSVIDLSSSAGEVTLLVGANFPNIDLAKLKIDSTHGLIKSVDAVTCDSGRATIAVKLKSGQELDEFQFNECSEMISFSDGKGVEYTHSLLVLKAGAFNIRPTRLQLDEGSSGVYANRFVIQALDPSMGVEIQDVKLEVNGSLLEKASVMVSQVATKGSRIGLYKLEISNMQDMSKIEQVRLKINVKGQLASLYLPLEFSLGKDE